MAGDISFGIYLIHFNIVTLVYNLVRATDLNLGWIVFLATLLATFSITIPLAWLSYVYIETPGIALGSAVIRYLNRRNSVG